MLSSKCRTCLQVESLFFFPHGRQRQETDLAMRLFFSSQAVLTIYSSILPVSMRNIHKPVMSGKIS